MGNMADLIRILVNDLVKVTPCSLHSFTTAKERVKHKKEEETRAITLLPFCIQGKERRSDPRL